MSHWTLFVFARAWALSYGPAPVRLIRARASAGFKNRVTMVSLKSACLDSGSSNSGQRALGRTDPGPALVAAARLAVCAADVVVAGGIHLVLPFRRERGLIFWPKNRASGCKTLENTSAGSDGFFRFWILAYRVHEDPGSAPFERAPVGLIRRGSDSFINNRRGCPHAPAPRPRPAETTAKNTLHRIAATMMVPTFIAGGGRRRRAHAHRTTLYHMDHDPLVPGHGVRHAGGRGPGGHWLRRARDQRHGDNHRPHAVGDATQKEIIMALSVLEWTTRRRRSMGQSRHRHGGRRVPQRALWRCSWCGLLQYLEVGLATTGELVAPHERLLEGDVLQPTLVCRRGLDHELPDAPGDVRSVLVRSSVEIELELDAGRRRRGGDRYRVKMISPSSARPACSAASARRRRRRRRRCATPMWPPPTKSGRRLSCWSTRSLRTRTRTPTTLEPGPQSPHQQPRSGRRSTRIFTRWLLRLARRPSCAQLHKCDRLVSGAGGTSRRRRLRRWVRRSLTASILRQTQNASHHTNSLMWSRHHAVGPDPVQIAGHPSIDAVYIQTHVIDAETTTGPVPAESIPKAKRWRLRLLPGGDEQANGRPGEVVPPGVPCLPPAQR